MLDNMTENPPWKIIDIVLILLFVHLFGFIAGMYSELGQNLLITLFPAIQDEQLIFLFLASWLQAVLFVGLPTSIVLFKYRGTFRELGIVWQNWRANCWLGVIGGISLFFLVVGVGIVVNYFIPIDPEPQPFAQLIMNISEPKKIMLPFIMGSLLAPIGEEFLFRGFIYPILRKRTGVLLGIILSSLVFASLHFDLVRMIPLAVGGMGLAWLYEYSGSLITPIVAHSVWNTIMTLMIIFLGIT